MTRALPYSTAFRALVALLSIGIALFSYRYLTDSETRSPEVLANAFAQPFLVLHVLGAATALLVSPFQFIARFRSRGSGLHRIVGRVYAAGCLTGAAAGFPLALGSTAGTVAAGGFGLLAIFWFWTTAIGWRRAMQGRIAEHRQWMLRSWALTMAAVTLRLYLPFPALLGLDFMDGYRAIAWLCWVPNLMLMEAWLRRGNAAPAAFARTA